MEFGADGYLYVSGGDGARWGILDYGQLGNPPEPVRRPAGHASAARCSPRRPRRAAGCAPRTCAPAATRSASNGSLIRIDPDTGEGVPGNPMFAQRRAQRAAHARARLPQPGAARDPARHQRRLGGGPRRRLLGGARPRAGPHRPGAQLRLAVLRGRHGRERRTRTRASAPAATTRTSNICENLYAEGTATSAPYWAYDHEQPVVPGEDCAIEPGHRGAGRQPDLGGIDFYPATGSFPAAYRNALFFGDRAAQLHLRDARRARTACPSAGGWSRSPSRRASRSTSRSRPSGDLLYIDQDATPCGASPWAGNSPTSRRRPSRRPTRPPGNRPLTVNFDAAGSSDPDAGDVIIYEWDLDGDGELDDSTDRAADVHLSCRRGTYTVTLRVTDTSGASDTDTLTITVTAARSATIDTPAAARPGAPATAIAFSGSRHGQRRRRAPAPSALDWIVVLRHCAGGGLPRAPDRGLPGHGRGSFTAPDHAEPGQIEVRLTATDSDGETETKTAALAPRTVDVSLAATPAGAAVTLDGEAVTRARHAAGGGRLDQHARAPASQAIGNTTYRFSSWRDGQPRSRSFTAPGNRSFVGHLRRRSRRAPRRSRSRPRPTRASRQRSPATNFGTENRLRTDDGADGRGELPALPGRRHHRHG